MTDVSLLSFRVTEVSPVSAVSLAVLAQLEAVVLLAPLVTMEPRYSKKKKSNDEVYCNGIMSGVLFSHMGHSDSAVIKDD